MRIVFHADPRTLFRADFEGVRKLAISYGRARFAVSDLAVEYIGGRVV